MPKGNQWGSLETTDRIMRDTFWIGVYPGMSDEMIDRMIAVVREGAAG
jgi:CDP-6-deoxy-D-xylo-4-hexulose-3-dehydrase